jgi:quercetin dioxygenase-like cupin family protein
MEDPMADATVHTWAAMAGDRPMPLVDRRLLRGEHAMVARLTLHEGCVVEPHTHENEQFAVVLSGRVRFTLGDAGAERVEELVGGQVLQVPGHVRHGAEALETSELLDVFSPVSETTGVDGG